MRLHTCMVSFMLVQLYLDVNIVILRVVKFGSLFCCTLCENIREKGIA